MRKGSKLAASRRINKRAVMLTMGTLALLILLFFASFWITSAILKRSWVIPIPQQSDVTSPEDSHGEVPEKIEPEKDIEVESQITDSGWGYVEPEKSQDEDESDTSQKPAEEKKPEQPSAPKEPENAVKPEQTQKPENVPAPEPPAQTVAPSKPPIEILPPNVTE